MELRICGFYLHAVCWYEIGLDLISVEQVDVFYRWVHVDFVEPDRVNYNELKMVAKFKPP